MSHRVLVVVVSALLFALSNAAYSAEAPPSAPPAPGGNPVEAATENKAMGSSNPATGATYPSDEDRLDGDHLTLRVNAYNFKAYDDVLHVSKCAPKGSVIVVTKDGVGENVSLRFHSVSNEKDFFPESVALTACPEEKRVNDVTLYSIKKVDLLVYDFRRSGVTFGGLVVPFKYYIGGDKKISPSSSVAPYIGFRGPAPFGLTFTPIISAGLGLVPVSNPGTDKTETKTALTAAAGFVLSSSKNQSFNAGLVIGKDYLSRDDRASDPTVSKAWFSVYLGYSL